VTGRFVVLEGGEGCGKSTQVRLLGERLAAAGCVVRVTHEPGGTARGAQIRALLLDGDDALDPRAELLLMAADRAQHVAEVIAPALAKGEVVVCDRFTPSSLVYQGVGRGLGVDEVDRVCRWAAGGVEPDIVIVLDVSDAVAAVRRPERRDRMERAGEEFHATVRAAYRELAARFGWVVVDGAGTPEEVHERVWSAVGR
jgi:dTMP kinase